MKKKNIVGLIAVRYDSKRLLGKALLNLYYKKLIIRLCERINKSKLLNEIAICTTLAKSDDIIDNIARKKGIKVFRGSKKDVMSRFLEAGKELSAEHIVRITGDNPLTDPQIIDFLIKKHLKNKNEYTFTSSAPIGTSSEVIKYKSLKKCYNYIVDPNSSEYMSWMLNRPDVFKVQDLVCPKKISLSNKINFTIDEKKEYQDIKNIYKKFKGDPPKLNDIIRWVYSQPKILKRMTRKKVSKKIKRVDCSFKFD